MNSKGDQHQHQDQEDPKDPPENLSFGDLVSWIVSHRNGGLGQNQRRIKKESPTHNSAAISGIKDKEARKSQVKEHKDKLLNITRANRATGNAGMECMICGKEIRNNQPFRELPKDKNCQEERFYHLRTCGPGSKIWMAFKVNGKKAVQESISGGQMSFEWENDEVPRPVQGEKGPSIRILLTFAFFSCLIRMESESGHRRTFKESSWPPLWTADRGLAR